MKLKNEIQLSNKKFCKKIKLRRRSCPVCKSKNFNNFYTNKDYSKIDTKGKIYIYEHKLVICKLCNLVYSNPWLGYKNTNRIYAESSIGSAFEESSKAKKHFKCFKYFFPNKKSMGYDIDKKMINSLGLHYDFNNELKKKDLLKIKQKNLTDNYQHIKRCNFYIVCVPTPVNKNKIPDIRLLKDTCKKLGKVLKKKDIIVFESTVFPGTSEDICAPILEKSSKLKNNKDFYICYSPERINPGDKEHVVKKIKKLIAIPNSNIKKKVLNVYSQITKKIVLSSSIKETELSKVIENIQRDLNIALMNEIYLFCDKTNLNFNNVLNQASTKWNFVKYNPGLVGGHCLPVDPYYFSHVAKKNGLKTNVTIAGRITNEFMCNFVIKKIKKEINLNKSFKKSSDKIIFAGLSYKKNVSDIRNSLALKIYKSFQRKNKNIFAFDPLISSEKIKNSISSDDLKSIKNVKYIIFLVYHDIFKKIFKKINKKIKIIKFFDNNI